MLPLRSKPTIRPATWALAWIVVLGGAIAAALFNHASREARHPAGTAPGAPIVRLSLGADLWILMDSSLLDHTPRRFPSYSVEPLESRDILKQIEPLHRGEMMVLVPAERFLAEEFLRRSSSLPDVKIAAGPIVRETGFALVLSKETEKQILGSSGNSPQTLLDWVQHCATASQAGQPVSFCMADPNTCSASWIALAELVLEALGNIDENQFRSVPDVQLSKVIGQLKAEIRISGNSDRLEMYKLVLGRYTAGTVFLVYDHLATPVLQGNLRNLTVVHPEKLLDPVVQAIIVSKTPDSQSSRYLPSLIKSWTAAGLLQTATPIPLNGAAGTKTEPVPGYQAMKRILDAWNEQRLVVHPDSRGR